MSLLFVGFGISYWYQRISGEGADSILVWRTIQEDWRHALDPQLQAVPDPELTQTILFYQRGHRVEVSDFDISKFFSDLRRSSIKRVV